MKAWSIHPIKMMVIELPSHKPICELHSERPEDEIYENAILIAAAPDLLEALQKVVFENQIISESARAAIAKATRQETRA